MHPIFKMCHNWTQTTSSPSVSYAPSEKMIPNLSTLFLRNIFFGRLLILVDYFSVLPFETNFIIFTLFDKDTIIGTERNQVKVYHMLQVKSWFPDCQLLSQRHFYWRIYDLCWYFQCDNIWYQVSLMRSFGRNYPIAPKQNLI